MILSILIIGILCVIIGLLVGIETIITYKKDYGVDDNRVVRCMTIKLMIAGLVIVVGVIFIAIAIKGEYQQ